VLLALGHEVLPVEPDERMRERLAAGTPGTTALSGSAEAVPLPDNSVDAVVAGQAYHWFDKDRAHPEIARVLRPGGVFAPVWNMRDESVPWVARLGRIADGHLGEEPTGARPAPSHAELLARRGDFGPLLEPTELREFHWTTTTTADGLVALMATRSYHITATPAHRAELDQAIRDLVAPLPQPIELPYVTEVFRSRKR